jgi:large subunit ribosomal protein L15
MEKALKFDALGPARGGRKKSRRVGRGNGSGHGTTCGRGTKGQKSRSGVSMAPYFEGGQMPLVRRVPKRGFRSRHHRVYNLVKVAALERFEPGSSVTPETLIEKGLVSRTGRPVKILGNGEITRPLEVSAHAFSAAAREKIQAAGGSITLLAEK